MALSISELNTVSKKLFDPTMTQQIYYDSVFLAKLEKANRIRRDGGTSIQVPIRYQSYGKADATDPRAEISFQTKTTRTALDLSWKYYIVTTMLHWDERAKNGPSGRIVDLAADKLAEMKEDFQDVLATALFASTVGDNDMESIVNIVDSATTYGGIAVADAAAWAGIEDSSTTRMLFTGSGSLSYAFNQATFGRKHPTLFITTKDLWSRFEAIMEPQVRRSDDDTANLGFPNIRFKGYPVVADEYCPSGHFYGLDMDAFELFVHSGWDKKLTDWMDMTMAGFPNAVGRVMSHMCNLVCRRRKTNFKFSALDYTL